MAMATNQPEEHDRSLDRPPDISSKSDLTTLGEVRDTETGTFLRSIFGYVDEHDSI